MIDRFGMHTFYDTDIVRNFGNMGEKIADPGPTFAMLVKFHRRWHQGKGFLFGSHPRKALPISYRFGQILSHAFAQGGLVVEGFQLRWGARLKKIDDPLGLWSKMGQSQRQRRQ